MTKLEEIIALHNTAMEAIENCDDNNQNIWHVLVLMKIVKDKLLAVNSVQKILEFMEKQFC